MRRPVTHFGRDDVPCASGRGSGTCGNTRGICRGEFDALILDTLRSGMMDAELLAAFQKVSLGVEWFDRSGGRRPSGQSVPPHSIARSADLSMLAEAAGA